jgi:hypothetical protein
MRSSKTGETTDHILRPAPFASDEPAARKLRHLPLAEKHPHAPSPFTFHHTHDIMDHLFYVFYLLRRINDFGT